MPYDVLLERQRRAVAAFYDALGAERDVWIARNRYYYDALARLLRFLVPPHQRVLAVGCGTGDALAALTPCVGVGVDVSAGMVGVARQKYPGFDFHHQAAETLSLPAHEVQNGTDGFDTVMFVNVIGELTDVLAAFRRLAPLVRPDTRVVIVTYNHLWQPLMTPAARLGWKLDNPIQNWLSLPDLVGFLRLSGFETVKMGTRLPCPKYVPALSTLLNSVLARLPIVQQLGFVRFLVARPIAPLPRPAESYSCTVVIPCKNEELNVAAIPPRVPEMGSFTELVFVDDRSTDTTAARVREAAAAYPDRRIRLVDGPGEGKGAAVRTGLAASTGDVCMILDADMTVMPEDLPAFFRTITENRGELVNGTRMIYPLADDAMRTANIVGNKLFARLFSFLLEQRITDTLCGTKVIMRHNWEKLAATRAWFGSSDVWGDYDWLFGAAKLNLRIVELPIHYVARTAGVTKMTRRLRNGIVMLRMCWVAMRKLREF